ncbi:MAG: DNA alkylation repair protein [Candidatus Omnitrophica bacterium]|nr:DNA alkylation repair protein [Candidatus Omnitrophota bacterium]
MRTIQLPPAPQKISKGNTLKVLLGTPAIDCLANNIACVYPEFKAKEFRVAALKGLKPLMILGRGDHVAKALREFLPQRYSDAIDVLLESLTPPLTRTKEVGLGVFFYLPHVRFVANYGLDKTGNGGEDPFEISMTAQYELTRRFTAEFSMRPYLIAHPERTLKRLLMWTKDPDPHVRRLCSEGSRPRLPWAMRIPAFVKDPTPVLPILEALKDDEDLYVRRSVANHVGDIAKDHPELAFEICERWAKNASPQRKWLIRHALRHPAKKGVKAALALRKLAG